MSISWLLFKKSIATSWKRLALTSVAAGVGVLILLSFTAVFNGIKNSGTHSWWKNEIYHTQQNAANTSNSAASTTTSKDALYADLGIQGNLARWQDKRISVASLYAEGANAPMIGDFATPTPGEYYVSPALKKVIDEHPDQHIGARFGTTYRGTIPDSYISSPDALEVIRGVTKDSTNPTPIYRLDASAMLQGLTSHLILNIVYMGIFILIFPVMLFMSIATQLGSAQREQRYAALRLIGATKSQITRIIATESLMATIAGVAIGVIVYLLILPLIQQNFVMNGQRYWPETIAVSAWQYAVIIVGTLLFALLANWWGMRKVRTSPLGVARRQKVDKKPRWWRILPLVIGAGLIAFVHMSSKKDQADDRAILIFFAGIVLVMMGLVWAGPWLTRLVAHATAKYTRNATILLGTKYITAHSTRVFRSVSGVVVALFAGSFYLTAVSGVADLYAKSVQDNGLSRLKDTAVYIQADAVPTGFADKLKQQSYLTSVDMSDIVAGSISIMSCDIAAHYTTITCPQTAKFTGFNFNGTTTKEPYYGATYDSVLRQLREKDGAATDTPVNTGYLVTVSSSNDFEKLRTFLATEYRSMPAVPIYANLGSDAKKPVINHLIEEFATAAYFGMAFTVIVAIASLAVSTIGGLFERQRTLLTLRLGGMEVPRMERMVMIESLIPLVITALLASAVGVGIGYIFMQIISTTLDAKLSPIYFAIMIGTILLSALAIYFILPMIKSITTLENNRTE